MDYATFIADPLIAAAGFADASQYSEDVVSQVISEVACLWSASRWAKNCSCDRRELAIKWLTAHRLTMLTQSGVLGVSASSSGQTKGVTTGPISSISASQGSQSLSFGQASDKVSGAGWLAEGQTPTVWWNLFLGVVGTQIVGIGFTM